MQERIMLFFTVYGLSVVTLATSTIKFSTPLNPLEPGKKGLGIG